MRKNLAVVLLLLLSTCGLHYSVNSVSASTTKDNIEIPRCINGVTTIRLRDENKISKKDLKDEIKRRKKYHKALLSTYNESFDPKCLDLISNNSEKIIHLRKLLKA